MKKHALLIFVFFLFGISRSFSQITEPIVLGYFPSWSESWVSTNQDSPLRRIPSFVTHVFLSFAKPDLVYTQGSYDISQTGIDVPYDGCTLKESVSALKDKGINVILSIGGETYWNSPTVYANINYQSIKDLVDDIGFAGIDWDFEPNGSFSDIGNAANVQHFIDFITNSRALMPAAQGYIIACAPSGVGALGGQTNNDVNSPYKFSNRNTLTGETDANLYSGTVPTNGINLFGFSATGHMIPVFQAVGSQIDIVAYQGYNCGGSTNRAIMYDAFAYYAELYGFKIAAGVHYPNEPWGPYYTYTHANVASLSAHIRNYPTRVGDNDGVMIWQLLLTGASSSAYSYMHAGSLVLNGSTEANAVTNATNFSLEPYTGGAEGCSGGGSSTLYCGYPAYSATNSYATAGTHVYYNCKIWQNLWWANPGELPGSNGVWSEVSNCSPNPTIAIAANATTICPGTAVTFTATPTDGGSTPTYQWQVNGSNQGTNSATFTTSALTNGQTVTCSMTSNSACATQNTVTSNAIVITVSSAVTPSVAITAGSSTTICAGTPITFTANPTNGGSTPTYQWQVNGSNQGTNSATFTTSALTNGQAVTCIMTSNSTCATQNSVTSNAIVITVSSATVIPTVAITASSSTTICAGMPITFTANPTNGGSTPTYQWQVNGSNQGTNSATFTTSALTNGQTVTCIMTSNSACASPSTANSNSVNIIVNPIPASPIGSVTNNCGSSDLTVSGSNLVWSNAQTSPTITVTTAGTYTVTQTVNGCTSSATTLTAAPLTIPVITIASFPDLCVDDATMSLTQASPSGGTYSGNGVTNNAFNPTIAGVGTTTITYDYTAGNGCSASQTALITVDACLGLNEINTTSISVFPNPTTGWITIDGETTRIQAIKVYDFSGRLMVSDPVIQSTTKLIDLSQLEHGTYVLEVLTEKAVFKQQISIQ